MGVNLSLLGYLHPRWLWGWGVMGAHVLYILALEINKQKYFTKQLYVRGKLTQLGQLALHLTLNERKVMSQ